jgi:CreA protein
MTRIRQMVVLVVMIAMSSMASADSSDPDLIFRKSTTFKFLTPNDKLAVYGIDDPLVDGVACHYTTPEKGGLSGALGLAEQTSDISLACRQYGPRRCRLQRAPVDPLQEDADRAGMRYKTEYFSLHDLQR